MKNKRTDIGAMKAFLLFVIMLSRVNWQSATYN